MVWRLRVELGQGGRVRWELANVYMWPWKNINTSIRVRSRYRCTFLDSSGYKMANLDLAVSSLHHLHSRRCAGRQTEAAPPNADSQSPSLLAPITGGGWEPYRLKQSTKNQLRLLRVLLFLPSREINGTVIARRKRRGQLWAHANQSSIHAKLRCVTYNIDEAVLIHTIQWKVIYYLRRYLSACFLQLSMRRSWLISFIFFFAGGVSSITQKDPVDPILAVIHTRNGSIMRTLQGKCQEVENRRSIPERWWNMVEGAAMV